MFNKILSTRFECHNFRNSWLGEVVCVLLLVSSLPVLFWAQSRDACPG